MDSAGWRKRIVEAAKAFRSQNGMTSSAPRLPRDIAISGDDRRAVLHIKRDGVLKKNMQDDPAAFEGWAMVLIHWGRAEKVLVDWEDLQGCKSPHFERFLYRLDRFSNFTKGAVEPANKVVFHSARQHSRFERFKPELIINVEPSRRSMKSPSKADSESGIETSIIQGGTLKTMCGLQKLDPQFPVGLYGKTVSKKNEIFTGQKSAIDLIGIDAAGDAWLFELKVKKNAKVGVLSELFFYASVLRDLRTDGGCFRFAPNGNSKSEELRTQVASARSIHAIILSQDLHPLVDQGLLDRLNSMAIAAGWSIKFKTIPLKSLPEGAGAASKPA